MSALNAPTAPDWELYADLFGEAATVKAKRALMRHGAKVTRAMRVRMTLSVLTLVLLSYALIVVALGTLLLFGLAALAVVGH